MLSMACVGSSVSNSICQQILNTSFGNKIPSRRRGVRIAAAENMGTEIAGVKVISNPPESILTDLGVRSWPKHEGERANLVYTQGEFLMRWGCPPSKFPWTYSARETCYLLKGKVKVYPDGSDEVVEIGAGDLVEFPKGMTCTWDVSQQVDKHYNFE